MTQTAATFAAVAVALYAAHHVGDYWVQTDHQARHKGDAGRPGRTACAEHVATYLTTQAFFLAILTAVTGVDTSPLGIVAGLLVSGVTHWMADRREHGLMVKLARALPGKAAFLKLGVPREGRGDNPSLGTGAWALDQSWHLFWGVFVAALLTAGLS